MKILSGDERNLRYDPARDTATESRLLFFFKLLLEEDKEEELIILAG